MPIQESLASLDAELNSIDQQLVELKKRRKELVGRREILIKTGTARAAELQGEGLHSRWESDEFEWSTALFVALKRTFRLETFRDYQKSAINAVMSGEDVLLVMSTGGGKSLVYQLPALVSEGLTLVISPLVSLMEDQILNLRNFGIAAEMLNANCSPSETSRIQKAMVAPKQSGLRLLYITPEKLAKSRRFLASLEKAYQAGQLDRIAIDEVHCASQWGNDFRPDYKFLNILKRQFPRSPLIGLTATATAQVIDDVKKILGIPGALIFQAGFNRPNLLYEVRPKPASAAEVLNDVTSLIKSRFVGQSGIVYCLTRKESEEMAAGLRENEIQANCYHADLPAIERSETHRRWTDNACQVVVATVAFGMGIDKPDVRFVIHQSLPKSLENYYQESGRAGRDSKLASCILYYRLADVFRQSSMICTEQTGTTNLYAMVRYCLNTIECRRLVLSKHFGVEWQPDWCRDMCDLCTAAKCGSVILSTKIDGTFYCRQILKILNEKADGDQKLTCAKLIDVWCKQLRADKVLQSTIQMPSRSDCEHIVASLLLDGYLKENFHFTPYSVISYVLPGYKASLLTDGLILTIPRESNYTHSEKKRRGSVGREKPTKKQRPVPNCAEVIELRDVE